MAAGDGVSDGAWAVAAEVQGMLGLATLGTGIVPPAPDGARTRLCRIDREPLPFMISADIVSRLAVDLFGDD